MANNIIKRIWNQNRMVNIDYLGGFAFCAEDGGHTFQISGIDDEGNTVALSGTVAGVFLRPDNTDVAITGSASGGVVSVTLPANCYDVPGRFGLTVFVTANGQKTAVYAAVGTVSRTSSGTVSPSTSEDVVDLINRINAAVTTIPASWPGLMADIAPTYSASAVYPVGAYCYYNGDLYRCITAITTAESWTAEHWTQAVLGNDVSDLKSVFTTNVGAIADIYPKVNLFNNDDTGNITGQGKYIKNDGTIGAVGSSGYAYTCLIPIELNTVYAFKSASGYGTNRGKVFLYDDSGNYIETIESVNPFNTAVRVFKVTTVTAKYVRLNTTDTMITTLMLVRGIIYPDSFVGYELFSDLKGSFDEVFKTYKTENLFNKNDSTNKDDTYISSSGVDTVLADSGYMCSHYIPIQNGETYCYKTSTLYGTSQANAFLYDEYGQFLEKITGTLNNNINTITISNASAVYLRINYTEALANNEMVVKGSTYPADYIAYESGYQMKDGVIISEEQYTVILQKIAEAAGTVSGNPLSGKKAAYAGDSICYGYGYTGGYAKIIAENNNMTFENVAVSGAKLVSDITGQLSNLPNDADYYIIEGGYNDYAAGNYTLGEIQNWGYAIDETTITGAIQYIFRYLYNNFPGKKYGFIFPHRIPQYGSNWDTTYRPAIKEALKKWGIPFIDLTEMALPIAMNANWRDAYTDNGDGIHPNQTGYETWYVPKITAWMKTL